ncbi:MAG TPA: DUF262 domain-containing protein, partial [Campylobacterales bacterium]|nr:DUF262 domain-containing protein [Campylobacterales bacterium]
MFNTYKKNYRDLVDTYRRVEIPSYQRAYVWGESQWEDFYNDLLNVIKLNYQSHFMGTVMIKHKEDKTRYEIIDGQQRLITLTLFLLAYRDVYEKDIKIVYLVNVLRHRINVKDKDNIYDALYNQTLDSTRVINDPQSQNILDAYQFFKKNFNKKSLFGRVTTDFNIYRILNQLLFIVIKIDSTSNPYLIFETLNTRGVELSVADLIKNHLLDKSREDKEFANFVEQEWRELCSGFTHKQFENLFQSYYQSAINRKRILKELTQNVNTHKEIKNFLMDFGYYVGLYKKLDDTSLSTWDGNNALVTTIQMLKSYPNAHLLKILFIPILTRFPSRGQIGAMRFVESFIFRYAIICQKDEHRLRQHFYGVAKKINDKSITTLKRLKEELNEFMIDDEEFLYAFSYRSMEHSFENSNKMVRYILYRLENYIAKSQYIVGISDVTIEHISSQSEKRVNLLYRLGNYTLMSRHDNEVVGNKPFNQKKA